MGYYFLHGSGTSLLIRAPQGGTPSIVYLGARLEGGTSPEEIARLRFRQGAAGGPDTEIKATLSCELGIGLPGICGLEMHNKGTRWAGMLLVDRVEADDASVLIHCQTEGGDFSAVYCFTMEPVSGVIRIETSFTNHHEKCITINGAATICLPVPPGLDELISFSGRWANEFQMTRQSLSQGGFVQENRRGRTSHDRFPGLVLCAPETREQSGPCLGAHLGWSGSHQMRLETLHDGRRFLVAGEYFWPGEMNLSEGETYTTPPLYLGQSQNGLSEMSARFHGYYREALENKQVKSKPRPVHYNTWEAIYFDHSPDRIIELASAAAKTGIERFVLDDGWFRGRRHDRAGLGDWFVDEEIYPDGLTPVINHVRSLGMEFGLWVEPEMVNPDSDLYRAHPDWVLGAAEAPQIEARHQLVLDLTRPEVCQYLFERLDALLSAYEISYLKWDMNRDINHPGTADGTGGTHRQVHAVYALIDQLRQKHPHVEIESCSSGGGRADFGILERTDRIWTSDSNDALDRQLIQRGASFFFPLSITGAHVGPRDCHITGRHLSMSLRAGTALFGHMGVEADITRMSEEDREELAKAIALYKGKRELIHSGNLLRLDRPDTENSFGVVAQDRRSALFSHAQLGTVRNVLPGILHFAGLDPDLTYRLKLIWPLRARTLPPHWLENSALVKEGYQATGDTLMKVGLQLPQLLPETCLIFDVEAV